MQCAQFFHFALATADEAVLLQLEIAEFLFVVLTDLEFKDRTGVAGELWLDLQHQFTAEIEESRFEAGIAVEAPSYVHK